MFNRFNRLCRGAFEAIGDFNRGLRFLTFDFGPIFSIMAPSNARLPRKWPWIETLIVLTLLSIVSLYSRLAQYETMVLNLEDYFLPDLTNMSTTHDSGLYLGIARKIINVEDTGELVIAGNLLSYILAKLSLITAENLEASGRYLVYFSAALTSWATYFWFSVQRQQLLGLAVAIAIPFYWPVYSRTSIGMVDTDLLNLPFVLIILAFIYCGSQTKKDSTATIYFFLAGVTNLAFYYWYARAGFLLPIAFTLFLLCLTRESGIRRAAYGLVVFAASSGFEQIKKTTESLQSFVHNYFTQRLAAEAVDSSIPTTQALFQQIAEISALNTALIRSDIGSEFAFGAAIIGMVLWLAQDYRRLMVSLPLLVFFYFYITAGHRFGYYAAPILLAGIFLALQLPVALIYHGGARLKKEKTTVTFTSRAPENPYSYARIIPPLIVLISLIVIWPLKILPPAGSIPPPVILAYEAKALRDFARTAPSKDPILVSWWDYGHELNYQTNYETIVDGANPRSLRNIFIARALISPNPNYAATQIRFASYFDNEVLQASYPDYPDLKRIKNENRDIYIALPRDLQFKMTTIFYVAAKSLPEDALEGYDATKSVFSVLYHSAPERLGPFERVYSHDDGLKIYRIPAPK